MKIGQHVLFEQLGVQFSYTVDGVTTCTGQMRHADITLALLVDDGHAYETLCIAEKTDSHFIQEAIVNFKDNF